MAVAAGANPGIARKLASSDKGTREKAVALLEHWLTCQQEIPEEELKKIWKGLFYCVWHADKAPVQAELVEKLAGLLEKVEVEPSLSFFKVFLSTMRREWSGIDKLRLDKFYLLLRKFLSHTFKVLDNGGWDKGLVSKFMDALEERAFLARDRFPALGVNFHLTDIFWDEFRKYLPAPDGTLELLLKPFYSVLATSFDKALLKRVRANIFNPLLDDARSLIIMVEKEQNLGGETGNLGLLLISTPVASRLFDLASAPSTSQANRKLLYELNEDFSKLAKSLDSLKGSTAIHQLKRIPASLPNGTAAGETENIQRGSRSRSKKRLANGMKLPVEELGVSKVKKSKKMKLEKAPEIRGGLGDSQVDAMEAKIGKDSILKKKRNREASVVAAKTGVPVMQKESLKRKAKKRKKAQPNKPQADGSERVLGINGHQSNGAEAPLVDSGSTENGHEGINDVTMNLEKKFDVVAGDELNVSLAGVSLRPRLKRNKKGFKKGTVAAESTTSPGLPNGTESLPVSSPAPESKAEANVNGQTPAVAAAKKKKVRFVLKNNLICKKGAPLPPLSLRTPPSATPRGSALKPGVQPGPIRTRPIRIARGASRAKSRMRASRQLLTMSMQKPKTATRKLRKKPNL
ncbi:unnamed protein product [Calypogeia fissa]